MSLQQVDQIISILSKQSKPYEWVIKEFKKIEELKDYELDLETFELLGLGLTLDKNNILPCKRVQKRSKKKFFAL